MAERGILHSADSSWDEYYYDIYDEHLPSANICNECGEHFDDCVCHICEHCGCHEDNCECWICSNCGERVEHDGCTCERCKKCNQLIEGCGCNRCDICEELEDPYNEYSKHCECKRCPDDYHTFVDTDDDGVCTGCENWDCDFNCNENHDIHQE
jgi:hypothetical protein